HRISSVSCGRSIPVPYRCRMMNPRPRIRWAAEAANVLVSGLFRTRRPRRRLLSLSLGIILIMAAVGYLWSRSAAPQPPEVVLTDVDPEVVKRVEESRAAVRQTPRSAAAWGRLGMVLVVHDFHGEANRCFAEAERL